MNKGIFAGVGAYLIWGFVPLLFKLLQEIPPLQITAHRIVWSFVILIILILVFNSNKKRLFGDLNKKIIVTYSIAAILIGINWLMYVWAVNNERVVEASLGYFINPLVSIFLGMFFLKEKLRPMQWLPIGIAASGILYLTISYGAFPWVSLILAFSFGLYGLVKKLAPLASLNGMTLETGLLLIPALVYLGALQTTGVPGLIHPSLRVQLLLVMSGVVTAAPLLLFAFAAQRIPLSMIGLLQYVAPTMQFLIGVVIYQEPFTSARLIGFSIIWTALIIFSFEGLYFRRQKIKLSQGNV